MRLFSLLFLCVVLLLFGVQASWAIFGGSPMMMGSQGATGQIIVGGTPVPASAAGFTAQVLQADFTVTGNSWSNTANYMTNCGAAASVANTPASWHFTYIVFRGDSTDGPTLDCSHTVIGTDTNGGGNQALKLILTVADYTANRNGTAKTMANLNFPTNTIGGNGWLPNEIYTKVTYREETTSYNQGGGIFGVPTWWSRDRQTGQFDHDYAEVAPFASCGFPVSSYYGKMWENPSQQSSTECLNNNPITSYHTVETLVTSDEVTNISFCSWIDGTLAIKENTSISQCTDHPYGPLLSASWTIHGRNVLMTNDLCCTTTSIPAINNDMIVWIKSIEIWSCSGFNSHTCPGTQVTNWCGSSTAGHAC